VASLTIGGMTVTGIFRAVAAATSMSSGLMVMDATIRSLGLAAITSASTRSWRRQKR
jgi:hypothetical protein